MRAEKFRVTAFGKAKPQRKYCLSVLYHDNDQGRCAPTVEKEVTRNEHAKIFDQRTIMTDAEGRFEQQSKNIFGGDRQTSGKLCGYLTNEDGVNKDTVVRSDRLYVAASSSASRSGSGNGDERCAS